MNGEICINCGKVMGNSTHTEPIPMGKPIHSKCWNKRKLKTAKELQDDATYPESHKEELK